MRHGAGTHARIRGLTLAELVLGMSMTALVAGAIGGLWYAVGGAWAAGSSTQSLDLRCVQASARAQEKLRAARYVFQVNAGAVGTAASPAASVLFWRADDWNGSADNAVQAGELGMIWHDAAKKRLMYSRALPAASMTADQRTRASKALLYSELSSSATSAAFKSYDFVTSQALCDGVAAAAIGAKAAAAGGRPEVEYVLDLSVSDKTQRVYGSAMLRMPTTKPR